MHLLNIFIPTILKYPMGNPNVVCTIEDNNLVACSKHEYENIFQFHPWVLILINGIHGWYMMFLIISLVLILMSLTQFEKNVFWSFISYGFSILLYGLLVAKISYFTEISRQLETNRITILDKDLTYNRDIYLFGYWNIILEAILVLITSSISMTCFVRRVAVISYAVGNYLQLINCFIISLNIWTTISYILFIMKGPLKDHQYCVFSRFVKEFEMLYVGIFLTMVVLLCVFVLLFVIMSKSKRSRQQN